MMLSTAKVQETRVQDAAFGRETIAFAAHTRQLATFLRLRDQRPNGEDHQNVRQRSGPKYPLSGNGR